MWDRNAWEPPKKGVQTAPPVGFDKSMTFAERSEYSCGRQKNKLCKFARAIIELVGVAGISIESWRLTQSRAKCRIQEVGYRSII